MTGHPRSPESARPLPVEGSGGPAGSPGSAAGIKPDTPMRGLVWKGRLSTPGCRAQRQQTVPSTRGNAEWTFQAEQKAVCFPVLL